MIDKAFKLIVVLFALLWIAKEILIPLGAAALWSNQFMRLVVACDQAMEASWYYRDAQTITRESETVQLLTCHDYDKTRKLLLASGLPKSYLSWLGLKSLELDQRSAEELVEAHRFREK